MLLRLLGLRKASAVALVLSTALVAGLPRQPALRAAPSPPTGGATPAPSPTATDAKPVFLPFLPAEIPQNAGARPKIIFIIGQGDPPTVQKLISSLAEQLPTHYELIFHEDNWLVPEPTWGLNDFLSQCAADPLHTQGAFVVGLDSTASVTQDHFFSRSAYTDVTAHILYAQCNMRFDSPDAVGYLANNPPARYAAGSPNPTPTPKSAFVWYSNSLSGKGTVSAPTLINPLALIIGVGSLVTAFIPAKTLTSATTKTFPQPTPSASNVTTTSSSFNPSSETSLAGALYANGATYSAAQVSVLGGDLQTWKAVRQAIVNAVKSMKCPLLPRQHEGASDETYRYPASQGEHRRAPFCAGFTP